MSKRRRSALAQAAADAALQFGPQRRDLHSTLTEAGRTRNTDIRAAQVSGGALAHQIRQSLAPLSNDYRLAERIGDVNNNDVLNALAGQSGVGAYLATIRGDRALNSTLSARELANAKGSLRLQANQALQGAVNDVANVRSNYSSLAAKIHSQLSGLTADQAKYVALNAPKIEAQMADAARAAQAARDAHRAAQDLHHIRTTPGLDSHGKPLGKDAAGILGASVLGSGSIQKAIRPYRGIKAPPRRPHLTGDQQGSAMSQINQVVSKIREFQAAAHKSNKKIDYAQLEQHFVNGYRGTKGEISVPRIGNAGPIPNQALIRAGFDIARYGRLTPAAYRALSGVRVPGGSRPYSSRQLRTLGAGARGFLGGAARVRYH